jgi:hypothetical protein
MSKKMSFDTAKEIVSETFLGEINSSTDLSEIRSKVVEAQRAKRNISDREADDAQLTAAREIARDLGKGYREASKNEEAKIVVCLERLNQLGG